MHITQKLSVGEAPDMEQDDVTSSGISDAPRCAAAHAARDFYYCVALFASFAFASLLIAWKIGGTEFYEQTLIGDIAIPVLIVLIVPGASLASWRLLRQREAA